MDLHHKVAIEVGPMAQILLVYNKRKEFKRLLNYLKTFTFWSLHVFVEILSKKF